MGVTFHESVRFNGDDMASNCGTWQNFVTNLKQQRLKGQIPVVTRRYAVSITIFFALLFLGISQLIAAANNQVIRIRVKYDEEFSGFIDVNVTGFIPAPVYFYYELQNTFRMHRSLSQAYCTEQLLVGNNAACDKFKNRRYSCENPKQDSSGIPLLPLFCTEKQKYYAPVGAAASIMFTDYFSLTLNNTPIAWTEDGVIDDKLREAYFQPREKNLCDAVEFRNTVKPIGWKHHVCEMGGYRNISLIKWLESTTNKNFKKLYRILDTKKHNGLKQGVYRLQVDNVYNPSVINCTKHKMTKYFWILHPSWLGTEQTFLEKTYLLVGLGLLALSCCLVGFQIFLMDRRITFDSDDMF